MVFHADADALLTESKMTATAKGSMAKCQTENVRKKL